jgi:hypothetical protein
LELSYTIIPNLGGHSPNTPGSTCTTCGHVTPNNNNNTGGGGFIGGGGGGNPPNPPTTPPTTPDTTPPPNNNLTTPENVIPDSVIQEILKQENPVIDLTKTDGTVISAEALQAIAENGVDVKTILENGFTFTIIADSISPNAKAFDLDIEIIFKEKAAPFNGRNIPANSIVIAPNFSGDFGFDVHFSFTVEELAEAGINGNNVKLWHVDYNGNVTDTGRVKLNADGGIDFTISSASFYVLSEVVPLGTADIITDPETSDTTPDNSTTPDSQTTDPDSNPKTGIAAGFAVTAILAGGALGFSRKRKKHNGLIRA